MPTFDVRNIPVVTSLILGLGARLAAQASATTQAVVRGAVGRQVDDFLTRQSGFGYSGNVLLIVHDSIVLYKGYGLADRAQHTPYSPETIFDIGSLAKQFTAAAVLKLERADRLALTDSIGKFLHNVPEDKRGVTIQELLTHTSGIASDFPFKDPDGPPYEDVGRDEAVRRLLREPIEFAPGSRGRYSNGGYILLAAIVEAASQQPFRQYVRDSLLVPTGLNNTGFWGDRRLNRSRMALGYDEYGNVVQDASRRSDSTWFDLGGGEVLSSLADLEAWRSALVGGRVVPSTAVDAMWTPRTKQLSARNGDYGYGWFIQQTPRGGTVIQHGGDYLGTGAEFKWFRDDGVVMITSTNVRHDSYPTRNRTDQAIPKIVFGEALKWPPMWRASPKLLRTAVGTYRLSTGGTMIIHEKGGRTFVGAIGQDAVDVLAPQLDSVEQRRAQLTSLAQRAFDGLRLGDDRDLALAAGPGSSPGFVAAVKAEVTGLGSGPLLSDSVLGTFATGLPRGRSSDRETTLVQFHFRQGGAASYAVRWDGGTIDATDVPAFSLAADTPIQGEDAGRLVGWNIVSNVGFQITPHWRTGRIVRLTIQANGHRVIAKKLRLGQVAVRDL